MTTAQQEFFTLLKEALEDKGLTVYADMLPPTNVPYPFVYMAGVTSNPQSVKLGNMGAFTQLVQVWHKASQRGTISNILGVILSEANRIDGDEWSFNLLLNETEQQIINDNTTDVPLMQGFSSLRVFYARR